MTKEMFINEIENNGAWIVNKQGYFAKIWKEAGKYIIRAYSECENGWISETYKRDPEDVKIIEENGCFSLMLEDDWVDGVDASDCESDRIADEEYREKSFLAILVDNNLSGTLVIEDNDEDIAIFGL